MGFFLIVLLGLTSMILGCVCAMAFCGAKKKKKPVLRRVAGRVNALKPTRCLGAVVMWVVEEREMKLLYCL